jgi:hypothetical protein
MLFSEALALIRFSFASKGDALTIFTLKVVVSLVPVLVPLQEG